MRIFALIPVLAAFVTAVSVDSSCGLEIGRGDVESYIALSTAPPVGVITHRGVIEVLDSNDKRLGYISKNLNKYGLLGYDPSVESALLVTFTTGQTSTGNSTKLDITATNLNPPYHFLGLIQGMFNTVSDLEPGSWEYLDIGGISSPGTPPGALPTYIDNSYNDATTGVRTAESAVWTYNATSEDLIPQWVNTNGSSPHEEFFVQGNVFIISGSKDAFHVKFPYSPVTTIKFKFAPA